MTDTGQSVDVEAPDDEAVLEGDRSNLRDRSEEDSSRVSFVELFYDLIFVFAVTQLAAYFVDNVTPEGTVRAIILTRWGQAKLGRNGSMVNSLFGVVELG